MVQGGDSEGLLNSSDTLAIVILWQVAYWHVFLDKKPKIQVKTPRTSASESDIHVSLPAEPPLLPTSYVLEQKLQHHHSFVELAQLIYAF